jgi:putative mRNA 3-end processing factor
MKIRFLEGAKEVGRSACAVTTDKSKLILDYGVMLDHELGFPMHVPPKDVDGIVMTHSHLDHPGVVPIFYIHERKPVFGTRLTFEFAQLLISDLIRLSGYYLPFEYLKLRTMLQNCVSLDYREKRIIGDIQLQLLNAGHVPGSAQALIEAEERRFVYSSDYNMLSTNRLTGGR